MQTVILWVAIAVVAGGLMKFTGMSISSRGNVRFYFRPKKRIKK